MDRETPLYAGLILSLHKYKRRLKENRNFKLNTNPREIDVRIIDQLSGEAERMDNAIAYLFERHNIIELKNPNEPLNIDVIWKGISYAAQYKSRGIDDASEDKAQKVNAIPMEDITLTFLRLSKPEALFNELIQSGYKIEKKFPGVYYLSGLADIKMQIVVGRELEGDDFLPLRVQRKNLDEKDAAGFIKSVDKFLKEYDKKLFEAIFQISIKDNRPLYDKLRKEREGMCNELWDFMKDEIDAAIQNAVQEAQKRSEADTAKKFAAILLADGKIDRASLADVFNKMGMPMPL